MTFRPILAAASLVFAYVGGTFGALADQPVPMTFQNLQVPSQDTANTASVWSDKITANNALFVDNPSMAPKPGRNAPFITESAFFQAGSRQVLVSVGSSLGSCDSDNSGTKTYGMCAVRLAVVANGRTTVSDAGQACFVYPTEADKGDASFATLGPDGNSVHLTAVVAGAPVPDCDLTLPLP